MHSDQKISLKGKNRRVMNQPNLLPNLAFGDGVFIDNALYLCWADWNRPAIGFAPQNSGEEPPNASVGPRMG
jgi:hypothetical protein